MNSQFTLSGFSDEIDQEVDKQFTHLNKLGIKYFEPRGINGKNIADLSEEEVAALKEKMRQYGIQVSSIGSPVGKIRITDEFEPELEKLSSVIRTAKTLNSRYVRVFSFYLSPEEAENYREEAIRRMREMARLAEAENIILLHENEKGIYGDTAQRCLELLERVNSPCLKAVFDPANFVQCGQKVYPDAFEMLKPYIAYMHIKDALADGSVVPAGYGMGSVKDIIAALKENGWSGFLSIEPHLGSFTGLEGLEQEDTMLQLEKSDSSKFTCAFNALHKILEAV